MPYQFRTHDAKPDKHTHGDMVNNFINYVVNAKDGTHLISDPLLNKGKMVEVHKQGNQVSVDGMSFNYKVEKDNSITLNNFSGKMPPGLEKPESINLRVDENQKLNWNAKYSKEDLPGIRIESQNNLMIKGKEMFGGLDLQ